MNVCVRVYARMSTCVDMYNFLYAWNYVYINIHVGMCAHVLGSISVYVFLIPRLDEME